MAEKQHLPSLPDVIVDAGGVPEALDRLAEHFDPNDIYRFIRFVKSNSNGPAIRAWLDRKIAENVAAAMKRGNVDYLTARRTVAGMWGFNGKTALTNFARHADDGWRDLYGTNPPKPTGTNDA